MDEGQSNYINIDNQGLYPSTDLPCDNEFDFAEEVDLSKVYHFGEEEADLSNIFDFGEEEDLSKIFDFLQEQPVNSTIIPSTSVENSSPNHRQNSENISELPNINPKEKQPMTTANCPSYSSVDKSSSRIAYQINDDDYSLSYIYSKGTNNVSMWQKGEGTTIDWINQEDPTTFIPKPIVTEQENANTNDMILQQPLPKIPILEELERESSFGFMKSNYHSNFEILEQESDFMKPKFFMNNPHGTPTSMRAKEQKNPKTNDMILQRSVPHILTLEKLESHLMMLGQENGIFKQQIDNDGFVILNSMDNEFQQKKSNTNEGPIRRSPNRISSRYQPFGREIHPNNIQGKSDSNPSASRR